MFGMKRKTVIILLLVTMVSSFAIAAGLYKSGLERMGGSLPKEGLQWDLVSLIEANQKKLGRLENKDAHVIDQTEVLTMKEADQIYIRAIGANVNVFVVEEATLKVHYHGTTTLFENPPELKVYHGGNTIEIQEFRKNQVQFGPYLERISLDIYLPRDYGHKLAIETASGDINTEALTLEATTLYAISGDIQSEISAQQVSLQTVSGDIKASVTGGRLDGEAVSGNLAIQVSPLVGEIDLSTVSGDIELSLPTGGDFKLWAEGVSGDVEYHSNLPLSMVKRSEDALTGVMGAGTYSIQLQTTSGDIIIY